MDTDRFLTLVARFADIDPGSARRVTAAVPRVLAEHLSRSRAADVLERLPPELQPYLYTPGSPERFGVTEFVCRVAHRDGSDPEMGKRHASAFFQALRQAMGDDEFGDLVAQLPREYAPLLSGRSVLDPSEKIGAWVAGPIETSLEDAWRLTEAVLETPGRADRTA
jgi:uncharacterized protein (DUF2267 family)